jgi:hypothetical protein
VVGVVAFCDLALEGAQFEGRQVKPLGLEAPEDLTDESARDAVGLDDDEGSVHDGPI